MTPLHTAARMALDALEDAVGMHINWDDKHAETIAALREALAAPMPEPVAWQFRWTNPGNKPDVRPHELEWREVVQTNSMHTIEDAVEDLRGYSFDGKPCYEVRPLYAAPPAAPAPDESFDRTASHCEDRYVSVPAAPAPGDWSASLQQEVDPQKWKFGPAPAPSNQLSGNSGALSDDDLLRIATSLGLPFGMLDTDYCKSMEIEPGTRSHGEVTCDGMVRFARAAIAAAPAPVVPMTDEQFADMVADASLAVDLAANPIKLLAFARAVLSAAPVVREPKPLAAVNRYCAAGMCLPKDTHEAGCTAHGIGTTGGGNG